MPRQQHKLAYVQRQPPQPLSSRNTFLSRCTSQEFLESTKASSGKEYTISARAYLAMTLRWQTDFSSIGTQLLKNFYSSPRLCVTREAISNPMISNVTLILSCGTTSSHSKNAACERSTPRPLIIKQLLLVGVSKALYSEMGF